MKLRSTFILLGSFLIAATANAGSDVDECVKIVPLPSDPQVVEPAADVPADMKRFSGVWERGRWNGDLCSALVVKSIAANGDAEVIYGWGGGERKVKPGSANYKAEIDDGELTFRTGRGTEVTFELKDDNTIGGKFYGTGVWTINLKRR